MNLFTMMNEETEKAAVAFFEARGCKVKPFIEKGLPHAPFNGGRVEFITNGGKQSAIKRIGIYDGKIVLRTCPPCYTKFYDDIQKIKELPGYNGTVALNYLKDKGKKTTEMPECFIMFFEGEPLEVIASLETVIAK